MSIIFTQGPPQPGSHIFDPDRIVIGPITSKGSYASSPIHYTYGGQEFRLAFKGPEQQTSFGFTQAVPIHVPPRKKPSIPVWRYAATPDETLAMVAKLFK